MSETLPLFPLGTVLFPGLLLPLHIFEDRYRQLVRDLVSQPEPQRFGVVAIREGRETGFEGVSASSSGPSPGNCSRSRRWSRTGSRGAIASTSVVSQRPPDRTPRQPIRPLRPVSLENSAVILRRHDGVGASATSPTSSATSSGSACGARSARSTWLPGLRRELSMG